MEIWKDIPDYEGLYQVSNYGNVKSLDQKKIDKRGRKRFRAGKILKKQKGTIKYFYVFLSKKGKVKSYLVHYLVAMVFLGYVKKNKKIVIDHIDNNPCNNNVKNLQIISNRENTTKDQKNTSSKYVGVHWHKSYDKWQSLIRINGKQIYLGRYDNEYDAHLAYQNALKKL
jgi:hypothetical protein